MQIFSNLAYFITQSDRQIMQDSGSYDKFLMFASVFRQLTAFFISFFVFWYGSALFLSAWQAVLVSFCIAALLFFIDMSIIASKWSLNPVYFYSKKQPIRRKIILAIYGKIVVFLKLIPRVILASIIGFCIATVAEIGFMHKAIDELLQKEALILNQDYLIEIKAFEEKQQIILDEKKAELRRIQNLIDTTKQEEAIANQLNPVFMTESRTQYATILSDISTNQANLNHTQSQLITATALLKQQTRAIKEAEIEKKKEAEDPERGAKKGPRWRKQNDIVIKNSQEKGENQSTIEALKQQIIGYQTKQNNLRQQRDNLSPQIKQFDIYEKEKSRSKKSSVQIQNEYDSENTHYQTLLLQSKQQRDTFSQSLRQDGLFFEAKFGPLGRYMALKKLHADPEYGTEAKLFSLGLKIFIILLELAPVLTMIFLSPYSFYYERMRLKRYLSEKEADAMARQAPHYNSA